MKKKKINIKNIINIFIKLFFFLMYPAIFSTAFSGVKYLCTQIGINKGIEINSFIITLLFVIIFTMLFGRFFCGFVCAFGIYSDALYTVSSWVQKKIQKRFKKKPLKISTEVTKELRYIKYIVLAAIIILCIIGQSQVITKNSPWGLFSRIHAGKLSLDGYDIAFIILLLISIGMIIEERFFCRFLCPMGAIFSLLPVLPLSAITRNRENCGKNCKACRVKCPANIEIASSIEGDNQQMGECFTCGRCVDICPKENVHSRILKRGTKGITLQIIKAVLFVGVCWWLNI